MKLLVASIFLIVTFVAQYKPVEVEQDKIDEASQAAFWEENLSNAKSLDANSKFEALRIGLLNMGFRASTRNHSAAIDEIFRKIQTEYLSTPGHAKFFADEIERERASLDTRETRDSRFDRYRTACIEQTLKYLPGPETVHVLGNYLSDDRDFKSSYVSGNEYISRAPANSHLACASLSKMGLRDVGIGPALDNMSVDDADLSIARAWWEEVKSGKRTFSFVGQKVEYRFKPDGSWDTIALENPPDDTPKIKGQAIESKTTNERNSTLKYEWTTDFRWVWVILGLILAILGGVLIKKVLLRGRERGQ